MLLEMLVDRVPWRMGMHEVLSGARNWLLSCPRQLQYPAVRAFVELILSAYSDKLLQERDSFRHYWTTEGLGSARCGLL